MKSLRFTYRSIATNEILSDGYKQVGIDVVTDK